MGVPECRESLEAGTREEKKGRKIIFNKIIVGVYLACCVGFLSSLFFCSLFLLSILFKYFFLFPPLFSPPGLYIQGRMINHYKNIFFSLPLELEEREEEQERATPKVSRVIRKSAHQGSSAENDENPSPRPVGPPAPCLNS